MNDWRQQEHPRRNPAEPGQARVRFEGPARAGRGFSSPEAGAQAGGPQALGDLLPEVVAAYASRLVGPGPALGWS